MDNGSRVPESQHQGTKVDREHHIQDEVDGLLEETRLWRAATSVLWVAWAIVQANLDKELAERRLPRNKYSAVAAGNNQSKPTGLRSSSHTGPEDQSLNIAASSASADEGLQNGYEAKTAKGEQAEEEGAFDYLGCAQDRALVFWGDIVSLGIVSASEMPGKLLKRLKFCDDKRL
jgi:choline kinase